MEEMDGRSKNISGEYKCKNLNIFTFWKSIRMK